MFGSEAHEKFWNLVIKLASGNKSDTKERYKPILGGVAPENFRNSYENWLPRIFFFLGAALTDYRHKEVATLHWERPAGVHLAASSPFP